MSETLERSCAYCIGNMLGKRKGAIYCSRSCKTRASDERRREDGRAHQRDRARYSREADHRREYARWQSADLRRVTLAHYGVGCVICGTSDDLELDHVHGNGGEHRRLQGRGDKFYRYLLASGFPRECEAGGEYELQLLCHEHHLEKTTRERRG